MSESTDGEALRNKGQVVALADGSKRWVKVTNRNLLAIEERYGGVQVYLQKMRDGAWMSTLSFLFGMMFGINQDEALDLIDSTRLLDYFKAVSKAIATTLGTTIEVAEGPSGEVMGQGSDFPGVASTPSPSSDATSTRSASGT